METACIEWQGTRSVKGYGRFGDQGLAHRRAWEEANGPIPAGMSVLHRCDNPPCINPDHLFIGTRGDNTRDMWRKGRGKYPQQRGETNGQSRLTEGQVRAIRTTPGSNRGLAAQFGVSERNIRMIRKRVTWRHVD